MINASRDYFTSQNKKDPKSMTSQELEDILAINIMETSGKKSNYINTFVFPKKYTPPIMVLNELQQSRNENILNAGNFQTSDDNIFKSNTFVDRYGKLSDYHEESDLTNQMCFIDQLKELKLENEDLKVCLKQTKEHYEKEKMELRNSLLQQLNRKIDNDSITKNNIKNENIIKELKNEINFLKNSLNLLEIEKNKHLDQNVIEKEELKNELNNQQRDLGNSHSILKKITSENYTLTQNQSVYEKTMNTMRKDVFELKKTLSKTIFDYNELIEDLKNKHKSEKSEILNQKNVLEDELSNFEENQKKLVFNYEKQIRDLRKELSKYDEIKSKAFLNQSIINFKSQTKIGKIIKNNNKLNSSGKSVLNKSSSVSNLKINAKKPVSRNVSMNNISANSKSIIKEHHSDVSSIRDYKQSCINILDTRVKNSEFLMQKPNSIIRESPIKLTSEEIQKDKLSSISSGIISLERENAENELNLTQLKNRKYKNLKEDQFSNIREKINDMNFKIQTNSSKIEDLKNQQKNALLQSLKH